MQAKVYIRDETGGAFFVAIVEGKRAIDAAKAEARRYLARVQRKLRNGSGYAYARPTGRAEVVVERVAR